MNIYRHRSWLFTIAQVHLPFILWGSFLLICAVVALSYLIRPIYHADTILTLDADLSKILQSVDTSYPSITSQDFIRYEFFATHNVQLMRAPQIAEKIVEKLDIRDKRNKKLIPGYFVEPSLFKMLFYNNGQGVHIKWIADTQQFAIKGYAENPDKAVLYSREYTDAFLRENSEQFHNILTTVARRFDLQRKALKEQINNLDVQIQQTLARNETVDLDGEITGLTEGLLMLKAERNEIRFEEKTYLTRIRYLQKEARKYEQLKDYEQVLEANPLIESMKEDIKNLEASLIRASVDYTERHPQYKAIQDELNGAKEALKKEALETFSSQTLRKSSMLESVLKSLLDMELAHLGSQSRIEYLATIISQYNERLQQLHATRLHVNNFAEEKDALFNLMDNAVKQRNLIGNVLEQSLPFFRVVSYGRIDKDDLKHYKFFPKRKKLLLLTLFCCLIGFSFFVLAKELSANTLYRGWQLVSIENKTPFSEIPDLSPVRRNAGRFTATFRGHLQEICMATAKSSLVIITSGSTAEGKASVARVLAGHHHRAGKSVVLVDGDFIHRSLSRFVGMDDHPGLLECISDREVLQDVVRRDPVHGFSIIPAGNDDTDEKHSFSTLLGNTLSVLSDDFDMIVYIDAPFFDTEVFHELLPSHNLILVVKSGRYSIYESERMIRFARQSEKQTTLQGIVVNKVPFDGDFFTIKGLTELTGYVLRWPFTFIGSLFRI